MNFEVLLNFFFQDCYKRIIADVCKLEIDENTKYIDQCDNSASPGEVLLEKWALAREAKQYMVGGNYESGAGCFKFAKWTKWAPYYAQFAQDAIQAFIADTPNAEYDLLA